MKNITDPESNTICIEKEHIIDLIITESLIN